MRIYAGTYSALGGQGIYRADFDPVSGNFGAPVLAHPAADASFVILCANDGVLYATHETGTTVHSYAIAGDGALSESARADSGGAGPCHLHLASDGKRLYSAQYEGGSVSVFSLAANGRIGARGGVIEHRGRGFHPVRQERPHPHGVTQSPDGRFVYVPDLGLDRIVVYRTCVDHGEHGLSICDAIAVSAGAGPRHLVFAPDGRHAYLVCELANTVIAFSYSPRTGQLVVTQTQSTLREGAASPAAGAAEIIVHPNGRFVYVSNRADDTIAVFGRDPGNGFLQRVATAPCGGRGPRHMLLSGERWLLVANQLDGRVALLSVDPDTGALRSTAHALHVPGVACIALGPAAA